VALLWNDSNSCVGAAKKSKKSKFGKSRGKKLNFFWGLEVLAQSRESIPRRRKNRKRADELILFVVCGTRRNILEEFRDFVVYKFFYGLRGNKFCA
jgi:hypothetical protein